MREDLLSLNNFNMPKVLKDTDANYALIIRLLLLEPGKFQSHPSMGVGLRSRYRYNNDENFLIHLQNDIKNQMSTYLPTISYRNIKLNISNNILGIIIEANEGDYIIGYNGDSGEIEAAASYVLDNL